jgi:predicted amidohydrolase
LLGELHAGCEVGDVPAGDRVRLPTFPPPPQLPHTLFSFQYSLTIAMLTNVCNRIYIAPNADDLPAWIASMQHIAKEGRCFVISCNQFTKVSDFPADFPPFTPESHDRQADGSKWTPDAILNHGGSCVVGPLGTMIAEPVWDKEGIVYAELNRAELMESRMDFDAVGSYSRPDIL